MNKDITDQIKLASEDALTVMKMFVFQSGRNHVSNYRHQSIFENLDYICNVGFKSSRKSLFQLKTIIYTINNLFCLNFFLTRILLDKNNSITFYYLTADSS